MPYRPSILWYERMFGVEERFVDVKDQLKCDLNEEDGLFYITGPNGKRYCAGKFEHVSAEKLTERIHNSQSAEGGKTRLGVVMGDVVKYINDPANNGAVFQVASQFNCLEFINPAITPEAGVDRYEYDHTQGPACSIACGAGTVYRNYFVEMPITSRSGQDQPQQGQTENRQLDGFDDVADLLGNEFNELFKQKNGYLTATEKQLDKFLERLESLKAANGWDSEEEVYRRLWSQLKIGVHYDLEVTSKDWGSVLTDSPQQRITEVFASAAAVGYSGIVNRKKWETLARGILDASYDAVFAVAAMNPTKKLFLTFIGGGVFQNSMTWISDAIKKAATRHKDAGIQAYMVCYGNVPQGINAMVQDFNKKNN